jgi:hypothetical protein
MWQFTSNGRVAGYNGPVDLNRFDGSLADLERMAGGSPVKTEPPDPYGLRGKTALRMAGD